MDRSQGQYDSFQGEPSADMEATEGEWDGLSHREQVSLAVNRNTNAILSGARIRHFRLYAEDRQQPNE